MSFSRENIGLVYDTTSGSVLKSIQLPVGQKVRDHYFLEPGQEFLIGEKVDDPLDFQVSNGGQLIAKLRAEADLTVIKRAAKEDIDRLAGVVRGEVASHGYGQEMTYLAKEAEARAWLADPLQDPTPFKLPCAEIGITGIDMLEVCTKIVAKSDEWRTLAAAIEAVRLGKKNEIDDATTVAEVEAIEATVADAWPTL